MESRSDVWLFPVYFFRNIQDVVWTRTRVLKKASAAVCPHVPVDVDVIYIFSRSMCMSVVHNLDESLAFSYTRSGC